MHCSRGLGPGELGQFRPGDDQAIIRQRLLGPLLAFANRVEAIGEVPSGLGHAPQLVHQRGGGRLAVVLERADQVLGRLPHGQPLVPSRSQPFGSCDLPVNCTLPPFAFTTPASTRPLMAVFLALQYVSASPKSPSWAPYCSNQASAQRVSASNSPSCSARTSSRTWLMMPRAVRTVMGEPSDSMTFAYRVN